MSEKQDITELSLGNGRIYFLPIMAQNRKLKLWNNIVQIRFKSSIPKLFEIHECHEILRCLETKHNDLFISFLMAEDIF